MSTKIYNTYFVCDNRIETVYKIKKEIEPIYEKWICDTLDQLKEEACLKDLVDVIPKGDIFWDTINRFVLYTGEGGVG